MVVWIWVVSQELERLYLGPEFLLEVRYAQVLTTLFVCLAYSAGIPLLIPIAAVSIIVTFWSVACHPPALAYRYEAGPRLRLPPTDLGRRDKTVRDKVLKAPGVDMNAQDRQVGVHPLVPYAAGGGAGDGADQHVAPASGRRAAPGAVHVDVLSA
jgi:hypothetical protein